MTWHHVNDPSSPTWPEHDIERLRQLWASDSSTQKIADAMGRSKNAVVGKAHRLGLLGRASPIIRDGNVVRARISGSAPASNGARGARNRRVPSLGQLEGAAPPRHGLTQRIYPKPAPKPLPKFKPSSAAPRAARPGERRCQWLENDGRPWCQCTAAAEPGTSWCAEHAARVFVRHAPEAVAA